MSDREKAEHLIATLDPVEREELLGVLLEEFPAVSPRVLPSVQHPSIVSTPGVCGGEPRLIRTRIPVWTLERMRQLGVSEIDILRSYPRLRAADLVQAWSYADSHRAEIERAIQENEED